MPPSPAARVPARVRPRSWPGPPARPRPAPSREMLAALAAATVVPFVSSSLSLSGSSRRRPRRAARRDPRGRWRARTTGSAGQGTPRDLAFTTARHDLGLSACAGGDPRAHVVLSHEKVKAQGASSSPARTRTRGAVAARSTSSSTGSRARPLCRRGTACGGDTRTPRPAPLRIVDFRRGSSWPTPDGFDLVLYSPEGTAGVLRSVWPEELRSPGPRAHRAGSRRRRARTGGTARTALAGRRSPPPRALRGGRPAARAARRSPVARARTSASPRRSVPCSSRRSPRSSSRHRRRHARRSRHPRLNA